MGNVVLNLRSTSWHDVTGASLWSHLVVDWLVPIIWSLILVTGAWLKTLKGAILGLNSAALCFVRLSAATNLVSVFLASRQQPASVRQQRWNHCAQRHQAWKQVNELLTFITFCFCATSSMSLRSLPLSVLLPLPIFLLSLLLSANLSLILSIFSKILKT